MRFVRYSYLLTIFIFLFVYPTSSMSQGNSENNLFIAVLGSDGVIIPVAQFKDKQWRNPWTKPFEKEENISSPKFKVPSHWYYYSDPKTAVKIDTQALILTDTHCLYNWGYNTNWKDKKPRKKSYVRNIIGIVFSNTVELIQKESLETYSINIREIFKSLRLIDNNVSGEGHLHYEQLGYFRIANKVYGFIMAVGWEGESYEIYEFSSGKGEKKLDVHGGGC